MTKKKNEKTGGENFFYSQHGSQLIILVVISAVAGIYFFLPSLWAKYHIPILFITAGGVLQPLCSLLRNFGVVDDKQIALTPSLAFILIGIFVFFFGYDVNGHQEDVFSLIKVNILVLVIWLILVLLALRRPYEKAWKNYRWIIAPAILILLFLFDTSWAQSTLSTAALKKNVIVETNPGTFQIHAEYPSQIPFDDMEPSEIRLWVTGMVNCMEVEISANGFLFATEQPSDTHLEWSKKPRLDFNKTTTAITLLMQPSKPPETDSQTAQIYLSTQGKRLETPKEWEITVESKRESQNRVWKKNFLDTSGTIVSLITAIFVGITQLDEEKKRQAIKQVEQATISSGDDFNKDFSGAIRKHLGVITGWNEWENILQEQFRKMYSSPSFEERLWEGLLAKTSTEMITDVELCIQVCSKIIEKEEEKPLPMLKELRSALQQDGEASLNLLSMLKKYPASIDIAKQIASAFHPDLKRKIPDEYRNKFPEQIRALQAELGFSDTISFPLQRQFNYYANGHFSADGLASWLKIHELEHSPFADAESPFCSAIEEQYPWATQPPSEVKSSLIAGKSDGFLINWASPGFACPKPDLRHLTFAFANSWDASAALFEYCKTLQDHVKIKDNIFFVIITPSMNENYGADHPQRLYLHALAEQWEWALAEMPTLFYSLRSEQRDLVGRLLRWHDFSPAIIFNKITEFNRQLEGVKEEGKKDEEAENDGKKKLESFPLKMIDWLAHVSADELRSEEISTFIGLRPSPKQHTLFLISAIDLNPCVKGQISLKTHKILGEKSDWLSVHACSSIRFMVGGRNPQNVPESSLINQCKIRMQMCSKNRLEFNQLFDAPNEVPDKILAGKANGSPGKMVRLGQDLLLQHVERHPSDEFLHIEELKAIKT
jgi:hypothetical protein